MFERFTEQAMRVVVVAQDEARGLSCSTVGTEHLLLSMLRPDVLVDDSGAKALTNAGLTADDFRQRLHAAGETYAGRVSGHIRLSSDVVEACDSARAEADRLGAPWVSSTHLMVGVLSVQSRGARRLLEESGIDPDALRDVAMKWRATAEQPSTAALRRGRRTGELGG
jgi:ATP-dependent Clp protease ATP-binding subunit ClpC